MGTSKLAVDRPLDADRLNIVKVYWWVSKAPEMTDENILERIETTGEDMYRASISVELTPGVRYYYATQFEYANGGFSGMSRVKSFIVKSIDSETADIDLPSTIIPPTLTIGFDVSQCPSYGFLVNLSEYSAIGDSKCKAVTWVIEDEDNNVIDFDPRNELDIHAKLIRTKLPKNKLYTIRALFHGTNNDVSEFGGINIYTSESEEIELVSDLNNVDPTEDNTAQYFLSSNIVSMTYVIRDSAGNEVLSGSTNSTTITIPANTLENGNTYIISVIGVKPDGTTEYEHDTFVLAEDADKYYLPGPLPYELGHEV